MACELVGAGSSAKLKFKYIERKLELTFFQNPIDLITRGKNILSISKS